MPQYKFPANANYFFLVYSIENGFGGLTNAMLKRARIFSEKAGISTNILTFHFDPDFDEIRKYLKKTKKANESMTISNMYEFFSNDNDVQYQGIAIKHTVEEKGCTVHPVGGKKAYRLYKNGLYLMYKSFEGQNGTLKFIDYFNEHRSRIRREFFDKNGLLRKVVYMDLSLNIPRQELFFDTTGRCFLSIWYKVIKNKSVIERIHWFDKDGSVVKVFKSEEEMQSYWLKVLTSNKEVSSFVIVDGRKMDSLVLSLSGENIYKIFVKHSIHVRYPFEPYSVLRLGNRTVLENIEKADAIVLLTELQKRDLEERFGKRKVFYTIPHSISRPASYPSFKDRDPLKAVVLARYHEEKRLDHIIKAFKIVTESIPNATLELYGFGAEEKKLRILIDDLKLNDNVFVMGKTEHPDSVFRSAGLSILASKYEGFGLVILESLANGCPVISYDIKYGPSDMIENNKNGCLVPVGNIEKLADAIISYFSNPQKLEEASKNAYSSSLNFNEDTFMKKWSELFFNLLEVREKKNSIENIDFLLKYSNWSNKKNLTYKVQGELTIKGAYSKKTIDDCVIFWKLQNRDTKEVIFIKDENFTFTRDCFLINTEFTLLSLENQNEIRPGFWEVTLIFQWNNSYFEKKIGINRSPEPGDKKRIRKTPMRRYILPYYTKHKGNLVFRVTEYNPYQIKLIPKKIFRRLFRLLKF